MVKNQLPGESPGEQRVDNPSDNLKKILLVEDYGPNALVITTMFNMMGYDCDIAINGLDALNKYQHDSYHLILMDLQMPLMDGLETTRRIRAMEEEKGALPVPIIAMTAHSERADRMNCAEAGMNGFLHKDFNQKTLQSLLEDYIQDNRQKPAP